MFFSDLALTWELLQLTSSALSMSSTSALRGEQSTYRSVVIRRLGVVLPFMMVVVVVMVMLRGDKALAVE